MNSFLPPAPAAPFCLPADPTNPGSRRSAAIVLGGRYEIFCCNTRFSSEAECWLVRDLHNQELGMPEVVWMGGNYDEAVRAVERFFA